MLFLALETYISLSSCSYQHQTGYLISFYTKQASSKLVISPTLYQILDDVLLYSNHVFFSMIILITQSYQTRSITIIRHYCIFPVPEKNKKHLVINILALRIQDYQLLLNFIFISAGEIRKKSIIKGIAKDGIFILTDYDKYFNTFGNPLRVEIFVIVCQNQIAILCNAFEY